jgi:hypothetical protein
MLHSKDVALVRAEVLDDHGVLAYDASPAITFEVVSGEGRLWATHSGDPAADVFESPHGATRAVYHGLARAIVVSSVDRATHPDHRRRMREITTDLEHADALTRVAHPDDETQPAPIVLKASAAGLGSATIQIDVTTDLEQLPLAVAARAAETTRIAMA